MVCQVPRGFNTGVYYAKGRRAEGEDTMSDETKGTSAADIEAIRAFCPSPAELALCAEVERLRAKAGEAITGETHGTSAEDIAVYRTRVKMDGPHARWLGTPRLCTEVERLRAEVKLHSLHEGHAHCRAEVERLRDERDALRLALAAANKTLDEYTMAVLKGEPAPIVPAAKGGGQ